MTLTTDDSYNLNDSDKLHDLDDSGNSINLISLMTYTS